MSNTAETSQDGLNMYRNATAYTSFCADSIEWCPHPGQQDVFLAGNYELLGNDQGKIGQIYLNQLRCATTGSQNIPEAEQCGVTCAATQATYAKDLVDLKSVLNKNFPTTQRIPYKPTFSAVDRITTPAVLDLKWNMHLLATQESTKLLSSFAAAYEDGSLRLYTVDSAANNAITQASSLQIGRGALCLSLDWSNRRQNMWVPGTSACDYLSSCRAFEDLIPKMDEYEENYLPSNVFLATSLSDGSAAIADVYSTTEHPLSLSIRHHWRAHESMEAWITGVDYWEPTRVFTGSDDQLLKTWDTRMIDIIHPDYYGHCSYDVPRYGRAGEELDGVTAADFTLDTRKCADYDPDFTPSAAFPVAVSRAHQQGVCSIHCHPYNSYLLATGSYDDHLYIWDKRDMRNPLSKHHMNGGVWRVKWHPNPKYADTLLVVNMYNGVHIVKIDGIAAAVNSASEDAVDDIMTGDSTWPSWFPTSTDSGVSSSKDYSRTQDTNTASASLLTWSSPTLFDIVRHLPEEEALSVCESAQGSTMAKVSQAWHTYGHDGLGELTPRVIGSYFEHGEKTIAYGGDWCFLDDISQVYETDNGIEDGNKKAKSGSALIGTCSFYNKRVDLVRVGGKEAPEEKQ